MITYAEDPIDITTHTLILAILNERDSLERTFKHLQKSLLKSYKREIGERQLRRILRKLEDEHAIVKIEKVLKSKETIYQINPIILERRDTPCWIAHGIEALLGAWERETPLRNALDRLGQSLASALPIWARGAEIVSKELARLESAKVN